MHPGLLPVVISFGPRVREGVQGVTVENRFAAAMRRSFRSKTAKTGLGQLVP